MDLNKQQPKLQNNQVSRKKKKLSRKISTNDRYSKTVWYLYINNIKKMSKKIVMNLF